MAVSCRTLIILALNTRCRAIAGRTMR